MDIINKKDGFVTEIYNVDINELSREEIDFIKNLLYKRKVISLKKQKITKEQYQNFAKLFGTLEEFKLKKYHDEEFPFILIIDNKNNTGAKKLGNMWHSDSSYLMEPLPLTMLHAVKVTEGEGDTLFIDMVEAYKKLPEDLRNILINKVAEHDVSLTYKVKENDLGKSISEILDRLRTDYPVSIHPTTLRHPVTGDLSLYLNPGYTTKIRGLGYEENKKTLNALNEFLIERDNIYSYTWDEGDVLIWDNRTVIHCASDIEPDIERLMNRIGVNDGVFFGGNK